MTAKKTNNYRQSTAYRRSSLEERFHMSYIKNSSGCWLWIGHTNSNKDPKFRYGTMVKNKKRILAHRFSWELVNGPIPNGVFICHKCDNPKCVNPDHLFAGSPGDNTKDRDNKDRQAHGETHGKYIHGKYVNQKRWRTRPDGTRYYYSGNTEQSAKER